MNLRKRIFLMFTLIFVAVAIAACNANSVVTLTFADDHYIARVGDTWKPDVNIEAGSNYDANTIANQLVFSSSDESVVKVVDGGLLAVGVGETKIKVQWSEKAIVFTTANVLVNTNVAPGLILKDYSPNMLKGATQTIGYEFDEKYTDATVRWESANEDIATVDENGKITAVAVGEATIIAYSVVGSSEQSTVVKINVSESDFAINYVLNGGVNSEENLPGFNTLLLPVTFKNPTKEGYTFDGWYSDAEFTQKVEGVPAGTTEDVTVYAKWTVVNNAVTYVLDGGTNDDANPSSVTVDEEVVLKDATKVGYTFAGWYSDSEFTTKVEKLVKLSSDITLYAKFEVIEYTITYELNGGENNAENPAKYTVEDTVELKDPTKLGNSFGGWYLEAEFTTKVEKLDKQTGDVTLYAKFEVSAYDIHYDLAGGHFVSPYPYDNHEQMVRDFVKDFNAHSGKTVTVTVDGTSVTCDFFARSWAADGSSLGYKFLTSEEYGAKWSWMLDIINENRVARGKSALVESDGQAEARGDVHNFLCLCAPGEAGGNASFGGDYSTYSYDTYKSRLPKDPTVLEAPASYSPSEGAMIPNPVKDDFTFVSWAKKITSIETGANSGFWSNYETKVFLFGPSLVGSNNPTFSHRIGLHQEDDGTYKVIRIVESGVAAFDRTDVDVSIIISESHKQWASFAGFRSAVKVGQTAVIDGDLSTGIATVSFVELIENQPEATIDTTAKSDFWTKYETDVFLFPIASAQNPLYAHRIGIKKADDGTYYVALVAASGQTGVSYASYELDYVLVISESNKQWASYASFRNAVKVGQVVAFDGDPNSGVATVNFLNPYTTIAAGTEGELDLVAVFVQLKDENALTYKLNGGTLSEGAPTEYLTSQGLELTATAEKAGYKFLGWKLNGELITSIPVGKRGDLELEAAFEVIEYTIEYVLNGGTWAVDSVGYIYDTFDEIVEDFLKDYETKYGLSGLTAANFFSKSNSYGLVSFFKDDALSAKWNWLVEFMLGYNPNYNGLTYMKNPSSATNYNKYWRANLAAFLQKSKITSPLSMDFSNLDVDKFFADNVPTTTVTVAADPAYKYTVEQLPLELAAPTREDAKFVGWCDNELLKNEFNSIAAGTLGNLKLFAKWSDSVEGKDTMTITYDLDGGKWALRAPTAMEIGKEFVADFNAQCGTEVDPGEIDTDYMGGSTFGAFFQNAQNLAKWSWLLDALWEAAEGDAEFKSDVADFSQNPVRAFYMANLSGYFTSSQHMDTWYEKVSADYSNPEVAAVVDAKLTPSIEVPGPAEFKFGEGVAELPTPVRENFMFLGWSLEKGSTDYVTSIAKNTVTDVTLYANWKVDAHGDRTITYDLDGGSWASVYPTPAEIGKEFVADFNAQCGTEVDPGEIDTDYMGGSTFGAYFQNAENLAKWKWLLEGLWEAAAAGDEALKPDTADFSQNSVRSFYMANLSGFFTSSQHMDTWYEKVSADYSNPETSAVVLAKAEASLDEGPAKYTIGEGVAELPTPVRQDFKFLGWSKVKGSTEYVTSISKEEYENLTLYANWLIDIEGERTIEYDLDGGSWKASYPTPAEIGKAFVADFNAQCGTEVDPGEIDTDYMGGSTFGAYFQNAENLAKWKWLLEGLWDAAAAGNEALKPDTADFSQDSVRSFYMANLSGFFTSSQHMDTWYEKVSADYSNPETSAVVLAKAEATYDKGPEQYSIGVGVAELPTPVREGYTFVGWSLEKGSTKYITAIGPEQYENLTLYANWSSGVVVVNKSINYDLDGGELPEGAPVEFEVGVGVALVNPTKEGFEFLGWSLEAGSTTYVTAISADEQEDVTLYANWKAIQTGPKTLNVGEGQPYATIADAMAVANNGDTLVLAAGSYEGALIDKSVAIYGPNRGLNPNTDTRLEEAMVSTDLTIFADDVVIDGICLTDKGRIATSTADNVVGLTITNLLVKGSTVNYPNDSSQAPINLVAGADFKIYDVSLTNSRYIEGTGRPMIMFIEGVENLTITDNEFIMTRVNFNDGIKTNNNRVCISGNVVINHNKFTNLAQYTIWFRGFGAGNYEIVGNEFENIGSEGIYLHAAVTFAASAFKGESTDQINVLIQNNTVNNGFALLRDEASDGLTAEHTVLVKYNIVQGNDNTPYYVKNASAMTVICDSNYWGVADAPDAKFLGVTRTNDLSSADDVPSEEDAWLLDKLLVGEGKTYATITEALAAAVDGDTIYVFPGTYDEEVTVNKQVTILGANYGVKGAANRENEAVVTKKFTVAADNVVIDGLKFTDNGNVVLAGKNLVVKNIVMLAGVIMPGSDARKGQLVNNGAVENILITDSYFNVGATEASGRDNIIFSDYEAKDITITNNYLGNEIAKANPTTYSEAVKITKPMGKILIANNDIRFTTDNFIIFCGSVENNADAIVVQDNILGAFESTANGTAGVAIRNSKAGQQIDIIHNYFLHHNGSTIDFRYSGAAYATVMYNSFDENTPFKIANPGDVIRSFVGNHYAVALSTETVVTPEDYGTVATVEEMEELYKAYLASLNEIPNTKLTFELNGGYLEEELPAEHEYGVETKLPVPYKEGYKFLGWSLEENGTSFIKSIGPKVKDAELTIYAIFEYVCITVGEGGQYATLTEALQNAKEFDVIKVLPGTYDEAVTVNVNYIRIEGANAGIKHNGERGAESIVKSMVLADGARNITIDGFKFSAAEGLTIHKANNINVLNSLFGATPTADGQSMIYGDGTVDGLNIYGCSFITESARTHYRAIRHEASGAYIKNVNIEACSFVNDAASSVFIDGVKFANVNGDISITHCHFDWAGDNWTVFINSASLTAPAVINFNYNDFSCERDVTQSGATFRFLRDDTVVNIIGNRFSHVGGTVLQTIASNSGQTDATKATLAHVTYRDNVFVDTSTKIGINVKEDNFVFENNYAYQAYNWAGALKPADTKDAASEEAALAGSTVHKISYAVLPGAMFGMAATEFVEGYLVNVSKFIPTLTGKRFVGWHLAQDLSDEVVTSVGTQTADVTLYAEFEEIPAHTITYVLNGGELTKPVTSVLDDCVLVLPTPEKFGSSFVGWSLVEGGTDYVNKVTVLEDVTVYANWIDEEIYDVTLVLNGGSARYASRDEVVNDFIADYNKVMGTNWTKPADIGSDSFSPISWHTFYTKDLTNKQTVRDKWLWLAEYLLVLSKAQLASNNCNVTGLTKLVNNGSYSGDDVYGLLYAFRSFLQGNTARPGSSYTSVDFSVYDNANGFWPTLSKAEPTAYQFTASQTLPQASLEKYQFDGWYLDKDFTGEPVTSVSANCTLYAKFSEANPVTAVTITNKVTELVKFDTLQLAWELTPANAAVSNVSFTSSDPTVATVDSNGLITTLKEGNVTITITSASGTHPTDTVTFEVYSPKHFEVSYKSDSYTTVGGELELVADLIDRDGSKAELEWAADDSGVASVDQTGKVTALKKGMAKITATDKANGSFTYDFYVTVVDDEVSKELQQVLDAHNSNTFVRYDLGIGAGKPAFYRDIIGSVSNIMYNEDFAPDLTYYKDGTTGSNHGGKKSSIEWIVIHYTGNMSKGSTAKANANYFTNQSDSTSINYVVGNDGIFYCLDNDYVAYHAGDGTGVTFQWYDSGINYVEGDPVYPVPGLVKVGGKYYYTLNGKQSTVEMPDWKSTATDNAKNSPTSAYHVFEDDYSNPKWFNDLGLPVKVENGKYYIGTTWWCYSQVLEGRICSRGGNLNGIGIESCVNPEADLWYTWQKLAQLTAYLMHEYNLDITRVKMHHFFSAKDCHQPFLANNCEIWWVFLEQVKAEYNRTYGLSGAKFEFTVNSEDNKIVDQFGRVTTPNMAKTIRYTVKVTVGDTVQEVTLATAVNGLYAK